MKRVLWSGVIALALVATPSFAAPPAFDFASLGPQASPETVGTLRDPGARAAEMVTGMVTNDVLTLSPGQGCYAALLTHKGKMRLDMRILRGPDWIWIDTEPGADAVLLRTLETYSLGRDVSWEPATEQIVSLIGNVELEATPPSGTTGKSSPSS